MTTQWPVLRAGLVTLLPTLPGWSGVAVYDGQPLAGDQTTSYAAVGYVDGDPTAGSFTQTPDGSGFFDTESGEVRSELFVGTGDDDLPGVITTAFGLVDALKDYLRQDRTAGVLPKGSTTSLAADVQTGKDSGVGVLLVLTVSYTSPIT